MKRSYLSVSEVTNCGSIAGGGGLPLLNNCWTAELDFGAWIVRMSGVSSLLEIYRVNKTSNCL